jgi:hypothetical protein
VECFGRAKPDRLEFLHIEFDRSARELSREKFAQSVRRLCEHEFPDETLDSITSSADLEHSLSGNYARGVLRRGSESWVLFALPGDETNDEPARCLTFALLWLDRLWQSSKTLPAFAYCFHRMLPRAPCRAGASFSSGDGNSPALYKSPHGSCACRTR